MLQWPGYNEWKRQFHTRDETPSRNPITFEKFVRHIGRSINNFMSVGGPGVLVLRDHFIDYSLGSCFKNTSRRS
jgi:hypothetical protein